MASRIITTARWTILSSKQGLPIGRCFPSSFSIQTRSTGGATGTHAPRSDPGGVLHTRLGASRTAAFRSLHTVGFPSLQLEAYPVNHNSTYCGLYHAACVLVPSSFVRPFLGGHVECTPDLLAGLWSGGICPLRGAPTG